MFQGEVNAVSGADADLPSGDVQAAGLSLRFPLEGLERRNAGLCSPCRRTAAHAGYLGHREFMMSFD